MTQRPWLESADKTQATAPKEVVDLLGALSLFGLEDKPGKKSVRLDVGSLADRTEAGLVIVRDFLSNSGAILDRLRVTHPSPGVIQLLNEAFPGLKRRFESVRDTDWRLRLTSALEGYIEASQSTPHPIAGRNARLCPIALTAMKELAASQHVRPDRLAKLLDQMPVGTLARRVTAGGRVRRVVSSTHLQTIREALLPAMSLKATGRVMSLSARRVAVLLREGLLAACTAVGIAQLLSRLPTNGESSQTCDPWIPLSVAIRCNAPIGETASLFRAALEGQLPLCRAPVEQPLSLSLDDWRVSPEAMRCWVCGLGEGSLTVPQVADVLRVKQEVAYHLVRSGLIDSTLRQGSTRTERTVTGAALAAFTQRYTSLSKVANRAGVGARAAVAWANDRGLRLVSGPAIDGCRQYFVEVADAAGNEAAGIHGPESTAEVRTRHVEAWSA